MHPKRVEVTREGQAPTAKRKETASRETVEEHQSFEKTMPGKWKRLQEKWTSKHMHSADRKLLLIMQDCLNV